MGLLDHAIKNAKPREEYLRDRLRQAAQQALGRVRPGFPIPGHGIYFGVYTPVDRNGNRLDEQYVAFAAPEDLKDEWGRKTVLTFNDTIDRVSGLRFWHGYFGLAIANDGELYDAFKSREYRGEWIVPPVELLRGTALVGVRRGAANISTSKDEGAFSGTFTLAQETGGKIPGGYWSCTESHEPERITFPRETHSRVLGVRLLTDEAVWERKDDACLACRPVRLEPFSRLADIFAIK